MPAEPVAAAGGGVRVLLSGWGRTAPSAALVRRCHSPAEVAEALACAATRDADARAGFPVTNPDIVEGRSRKTPATTLGPGLIARGLGRSYGDAAQNAGGTVLDGTGLGRITDVDLAAGDVTVEGGVSLDSLMRVTLPLGFFPAVTPGTRQVTIGGAVAADIHGKNHHVDGSFTAAVGELTLSAPAGEFTLKPTDELFWATAGGMGLTGVITSARLRLLPVETSRIRMDTERCADLDELMATMEAGDAGYRYSVAWIDCLAKGRAMGRAVLTRGDHATRVELDERDRPPGRALAFAPAERIGAPAVFPSGLLNRLSVAAFNEMWFRKAPRCETGRIVPLASFFHPLDGVRDWNRIYGPRGFVQYQFVVPFGAEDTLRWSIERLSGAGCASFLAVLKRFGPSSPGHLSFPSPGWTLALDLPVGGATLAPLLDELDEAVAGCGGRVYLAKDARLRPELVPAMYPRLEEWQAVRAMADPDGILQSDLSRRLHLVRT